MGDYVKQIAEAGLVGAGGAGFPTYAKLSSQAEIVIVNGAECEPLLRVDQQLMALRAKDLLSALSEVIAEVGATHGFVALKSHYHDAVAALNKELPAFEGICVYELGNYYPAGDEQSMVYDVTGRIVPEGGIPLNVGVVVMNVETLLQVYDCVNYGHVLTDKYLTVTGAVKSPLTCKVPLGITYAECIELAGGACVDDFVVINGGPMMGKLTEDLTTPVTKTCKGLIVLPRNHSLIRSFNKDIKHVLREARTACMHCSLCTEVCPRKLIGHNMEPHKLIRLASYGTIAAPEQELSTAFLCCGCRLCEYACIMNLQPWKLHGILRDKLTANGIKNPHHNAPESANPFIKSMRFPIKRLIRLLGLTDYDVKAPLTEIDTKRFTRVALPLKQHIGAPCASLVAVGDAVSKGDMIANVEEGKLGVPVFSSIDGRVVEVSGNAITISAGGDLT